MKETSTTLPSEDLEPTGWLGTEIIPLMVIGVLVCAAAINPIEFNTSATFDRATSSTGPQTLIKLAIAGVATALGFFSLIVSPRTRGILFSVPGISLLLLGGVFLATSVFAVPEVRKISIASSILYLSYLFFIAMAVASIGVRRVLMSVVVGTSLYLLFTWGLFLIFPERGQFVEYTSSTESVLRMGGTGHPNNIAKTAIAAGLGAIALLMGGEHGKLSVGSRGPWRNLIWCAVLLLIAATLIATMSRTAILAGAAAVAMMLFDRFYGRVGIALAVLVVAGLAGGLLALSLVNGDGPFSESAVGAVTKSGDVEELTSLTGRTAIWEEAISFISARPITGYGLDSAASVMSKKATGTHNLLLHVSFSSGLSATVLMLGLLGWSLILSLTTTQEWIRGILTYVLVSGLVEDTIFESFPTALTLLWIVALLSPRVLMPWLSEQSGALGDSMAPAQTA